MIVPLRNVAFVQVIYHHVTNLKFPVYSTLKYAKTYVIEAIQ